MTFLGLGSAFWGVVIGGFAYLVLNKSRKAPAAG
jgi:benzoate membrane transport protein